MEPDSCLPDHKENSQIRTDWQAEEPTIIEAHMNSESISKTPYSKEIWHHPFPYRHIALMGMSGFSYDYTNLSCPYWTLPDGEMRSFKIHEKVF